MIRSEDVNRSIFRFNQVVDEVVLVPVAKGYRTAVPPPMRASVHDFLQQPQRTGDLRA